MEERGGVLVWGWDGMGWEEMRNTSSMNIYMYFPDRRFVCGKEGRKEER